MLKEDAGRVCNRSGPRVMAVSRNLIINVSSFLGKASLAAANRHGHVPPRDVCGTPTQPRSENETTLGHSWPGRGSADGNRSVPSPSPHVQVDCRWTSS